MTESAENTSFTTGMYVDGESAPTSLHSANHTATKPGTAQVRAPSRNSQATRP